MRGTLFLADGDDEADEVCKEKGGSEKKRGMQSEMRFSQAAAKENGHWAFWRKKKILKIMRSQYVYPSQDFGVC